MPAPIHAPSNTHKHDHISTHICRESICRGPDFESPLTLAGRGGARWQDYKRQIEEGVPYTDLQEHPFIVHTTAGEDATLRAYICIQIEVCMNVYIYMCINIYNHTYMYIHMW